MFWKPSRRLGGCGTIWVGVKIGELPNWEILPQKWYAQQNTICIERLDWEMLAARDGEHCGPMGLKAGLGPEKAIG